MPYSLFNRLMVQSGGERLANKLTVSLFGAAERRDARRQETEPGEPDTDL